MSIKGSVELTKDSDRASGQAAMMPKRKHVGNDVIKTMMLMHIIQNFLVSTQMLICQ